MKAKLTQFQVYVTTARSYDSLSVLHSTELECRLTIIEKLHNEFDALQTELETLSDVPEEQYAERELFENQFFPLVAGARQLLTVSSDNNGRSGSVSGSDEIEGEFGTLCAGNVHLPRRFSTYKQRAHVSQLFWIMYQTLLTKVPLCLQCRAMVGYTGSLSVYQRWSGARIEVETGR